MDGLPDPNMASDAANILLQHFLRVNAARGVAKSEVPLMAMEKFGN